LILSSRNMIILMISLIIIYAYFSQRLSYSIQIDILPLLTLLHFQLLFLFIAIFTSTTQNNTMCIAIIIFPELQFRVQSTHIRRILFSIIIILIFLKWFRLCVVSHFFFWFWRTINIVWQLIIAKWEIL